MEEISAVHRGEKFVSGDSKYDFFCVGVVYSGEYDVCDVTLSGRAYFSSRGRAYFSSSYGVDIHSE
jgi:hypothetical protein